MITLKNEAEIEAMARGGRILAQVLENLQTLVAPGVTTGQLDQQAHRMIEEAGCKPAFLGYKPAGATRAYPATLCTSVNHVIVHGTPGTYVIKDGDVVKLDIGLIYDGWYLDAAATVCVGSVDPRVHALVETTRRALAQGIEAFQVGNHLGDIGFAIESCINASGFHVSEHLTGHGIGRHLHDDPYVYNTGRPGRGIPLVAGMVFAIEPMVAIGTSRVRQNADESFSTADGSVAAHFEHTIALTASGPRILTLPR